LIEPTKRSRVSGAERPAVKVAVKTLDREQTVAERQKALRLFCRAMIRLYLQDNSEQQNGNGLGVL
jgi:hypothetical protein